MFQNLLIHLPVDKTFSVGFILFEIHTDAHICFFLSCKHLHADTLNLSHNYIHTIYSYIRMWFLMGGHLCISGFFSLVGSMITFEIAHKICSIHILLCNSEFIPDIRFLGAITLLSLPF